MFNPLKTSKKDVEQLFEFSSENILINDKPSRGIITESNFFKESEDKHLHTLDTITTGDYIKWKNEDYMVINETVTKRHHKYKTLIRHCNYPIYRKNVVCKEFIGFDDKERPKYKNRYGDDYVIPSITSQKTFSIDERYSVRVADKTLYVNVQDTELNRNSLFAISEIFEMQDKNYKVINHDRSVKGVLSILVEVTGNEVTTPKPNGDIPACDS